MQELSLKGLIKALHRCAKHGGCESCPYYNSGTDDEGCINNIMEDAAEWLELLEGSGNNAAE